MTPRPHDPDEDMPVRAFHDAVWREVAEPIERGRRTPWDLKRRHVLMVTSRRGIKGNTLRTHNHDGP